MQRAEWRELSHVLCVVLSWGGQVTLVKYIPTVESLSLSLSGMLRFATKSVKLAPNGTNLGTFYDQFQYILARRAKMY